MKNNNQTKVNLETGILRKLNLYFRFSFLLVLFTLSLGLNNANSQETKLNINLNNVGLNDVLKEIQNQSNLDFIYNDEEIKKDIKISVNVNNGTIQDVLNLSLEKLNLSYKIVDSVIVITPVNEKDQTPPDVLTQTIRGTVIDKLLKISLPGANVVLMNSTPQKGTITDINGDFRLDGIPVWRHSIQISYIGYNDLKLNNLSLNSAKELVLQIELEERVVSTDEVTIKAYSRKDLAINNMTTVSTRPFSVEETEKFAGSFGDPSRMAGNFAGVVPRNDVMNDIVISGNSPFGLLWRMEGIEIPNTNHYGALGTTSGTVSVLNNNLLANSDFSTGAFPAEYGNALSGVFDLRMRNGNNQKREYVAQMGFNGIELGAEGPFLKKSQASYLINYRYSTLKIFDILGIEIPTPGIPDYQYLSFKVNIPQTKFGSFSLFGIGGISTITELQSEMEISEWDYEKMGYDNSSGSNMGVIGLSNLYYFNNSTSIKTHISFSGVSSKNSYDTVSIFALNPAPKYRQYSSEAAFSVSTH